VSAASARETARLNPTLEVLQMDLATPEFDASYAPYLGRFDLITCSEVVEHLADDRQAIRRLGRLLAPAGTLLVTVPGGKLSRFDELIGHQRHYSASALLELALSQDLDPLEILAWGFPFQNVYRTAVRIASRWTLPSAAQPAQPGAGSGIGSLLGGAYSLFGRALKPLFYLNRNYWGEQMLLVARKR
jgi:SAM-dependent methyltransferase